ncbi:hypothetical protein F352_055 [Campylobacter phage F352]|uniref:Uncharacterized protein n=3 Tax=Fletchervirus CPX TaxID=1110702 RepID=A0A7T3KIV4_9CAUD|nr:hypothetical protein F352_055 [Campylobacter phage F352]QPX65495.1 hypothetical protein F374_054 [Campylobacter phage F374]QPX65662.1 hypothetical protein F375_055 [Campylobacter phage F375]
MENYKYVYNDCLSLFMELQKSDDNKKLQIYDLMLKCIELKFPEITTKKNIKKVEEILKNYKEIETLDKDEDDYGTISWHYILCNIGDVYNVGYKVVYAGTNGRYSYDDDYFENIINLYSTITFLNEKLQKGCPDNVSLAVFNKEGN